MTEEIRLPVLSVKNGNVVANSRDVADYFDKEHRHVLRDIDNLVEQGVPNFGHTPYVNQQNGQTYRSYDMDRDGFSLLAMSFTGQKALKFKLAYIAQFNAMEAELRERDEEPQIVPYTPETEARLLVGQAQRTFGPKAAQQLWGHLGLPVVPAMLMPESQSQMTFTFGATIAANQNLPRAA